MNLEVNALVNLGFFICIWNEDRYKINVKKLKQNTKIKEGRMMKSKI